MVTLPMSRPPSPVLPSDSDTKERLSLAYARAVAARCRAYISAEEGGEYSGTDGLIVSALQPKRVIALQLKSTSNPVAVVGNHIAWPLAVDTYDHLRRTDAGVPQILVVVQLATSPDDWVRVSALNLRFRRTAWWTDLWGEPGVSNASTITVHIPKRRLFTPRALASIFGAMAQIASGAPRKPLHAY